MLSFISIDPTQASTWRGLIMLLTSMGVAIAPELIPYIISVGTGLAGIAGFFFKDKTAASV